MIVLVLLLSTRVSTMSALFWAASDSMAGVALSSRVSGSRLALVCRLHGVPGTGWYV